MDLPAQPNVRVTSLARPILFWLALLGTGIGADLAGAALMALLRVIQHAAWSYRTGYFLDAVKRASSGQRVVVVLGAGLVAAAGVLLIRAFLREGPGLSAAIWLHSGRLPILRTCANAVLSMVLVGLGASLGREVGPKEAGAAVASGLATRIGLSSSECQLLVACGAGAGMAAV